ncbi:MAG: SGNH/GDSL hydrolase family protein, partial [Pirellulaceae bacterium]
MPSMRAFLSIAACSAFILLACSTPFAIADDAPAAAPVVRGPLPPSQLPLKLVKGERIAFVGNSTAERMNLFGHFESLLHLRYPELNLVVRNFGRPADEVGIRQRSNDYDKLDDPLAVFQPDTFLCFFGYNESFAGKDGIEKFKAAYEQFLNQYADKYPRDDQGAKPRFVLISPIAFEATGNPLLPDGNAENANLALYTQAVAEVAKKHQLAFVDIFQPTQELFAAEPGAQYTTNGCHVNDHGDQALATVLDAGLFGKSNRDIDASTFERLIAAVNDKSWVHEQDYRMLNGWYVYGGRRTWDTETFPREYAKIRAMAAVRDQRVWDIANGKLVPEKPDDSQTGELFVPKTRFGEPRQAYSEATELRYLSPDDLIKSCTVPEGFEIKLFADETRFPELAKPVHMCFVNRGRLWV